MKKISLIFLSLALLVCVYSQQATDSSVISDPKGAIIIAQLEGVVTVVNNTTG